MKPIYILWMAALGMTWAPQELPDDQRSELSIGHHLDAAQEERGQASIATTFVLQPNPEEPKQPIGLATLMAIQGAAQPAVNSAQSTAAKIITAAGGISESAQKANEFQKAAQDEAARVLAAAAEAAARAGGHDSDNDGQPGGCLGCARGSSRRPTGGSK